jgi:hypothetical protein
LTERPQGPGYSVISGLQSTAWKSRLPPMVLPVSIGLLVLAVIGSNSVLAVGAIVLLVIGSALLWRPGESPILLFVFGYQWLQISAGIFYAGWLGLSISEFSPYHGDMQTAATLSLIALLLLSFGMRLGAGAIRPRDAEIARLTVQRHSTGEWFSLYVVAWLVGTLSQSLAWIVPGLSQPMLAVADLKWAFFLMLTYAAFSVNGVRTYWLMAFALELVSSLGGYFSDFKAVFFFTIFGVIAAQARFAVRVYIGIAALGVILLTMAVVWTAIKNDYRNFVNGGQHAQVVTVGFPERIDKLAELVSKVDGPTLSNGVDGLIRRLAYLDFFAAVVNYVPRVIPHEGGAIWLDAIVRPITPRILFPEKSQIDDSVRTNKYTGLHVSGAGEGTSISIGYMGEAYIDFGAFGMMPVVAAFGFFLGRIYRYMLTSRASRGLLGMGLATTIIQEAAPFEQSITKAFGAIIVMLLISWLLIRIVIPNYAPWVVRAKDEACGAQYRKGVRPSSVPGPL